MTYPERFASCSALSERCLFASMPWVLVALVLLSSPAEAKSLRIAVAEFANGSADKTLDPLGKGLQSMVVTDLSAAPGVTMIERQRFSDIVAEQKLARTGYVDRKRAVRMGKLLGASHLVTGSFVVLDRKMRLDVRLFEVESGKVLLAAEASGERDAFFEVEKKAVKDLIRAMGVDLRPKDRAAVGRIHTADFQAFRDFSEGVALFDQKRYREAISKLRAASARDEDFKLARLTIAEYETLIARLRARAATIEQTTAELARLEYEGRAAEQAAVSKKLFAVAARKGPRHVRARLTALYILAHAYGGKKALFKELYASSDRFAMERAADRFAQRFFFEAREHWPKLNPVIDEYHRPAAPKLASFDEDFEKQVGYLWGKEDRPRFHMERTQRFIWGFDLRLYLERRKISELYFDLLRDLETLGPRKALLEGEYRRAAGLFADALLLDQSTAILTRLTTSTDEPLRLRILAHEIEANKRTKQMLASAEGTALREVLLLGRDRTTRAGTQDKRVLAELSRLPLSDRAKKALAWARQMPAKSYILVGDGPVWTLYGRRFLYTGPRTDALKTSSIRFYGHGEVKYGKRVVGAATLIADGRPMEEPVLSMTVSHQIPEQFWDRNVWPKDGFTPNRGTPNVGIIFGVTDVDREGQPTRGYLLQIGGSELRLAKITDEAEKKYGRWRRFAGETLAKKRIPRKTGRAVELAVQGATVDVTLDGQRYRLSAKTEFPRGFVGLRCTGVGYAEITRLRLGRR